MADNRIFLAHTEVDFCLFIGKVYEGAAYYKAPEKGQILKFYSKVFQEAGGKGKFFLFDENDPFYTSGVGGEGKYRFNELLTR